MLRRLRPKQCKALLDLAQAAASDAEIQKISAEYRSSNLAAVI